MKNYLMFALMMGAIASVAFGQVGVADPVTATIDCPADECHVAPYFKGEGGFIGEIADGFDEVAFVVDCGIVNTSGTAEPNSDGIVAELLVMDNGLACADGGSVEIHGLMDGGWYWINDTDNSAVASLIAKDALGNAATAPANPGGTDITLDTPEDGMTSIIKQASTGRIGILHHILPEPTAAPASICAPVWWAPHDRYYQRDSSCMLGDGSTKIVLTADTTDSQGKVRRLSGTVYRRVADARDNEVRVGFGLWGADGQAHINDTNVPTSVEVIKGWDIATATGHPPAEPFAADYVVALIEGSGRNLEIGDADIRIDPARRVVETVPGPTIPGTPPTTTMEDVEVPLTHVRPAAHDDAGDGCTPAMDPDPDCVAVTDTAGTRLLEAGYFGTTMGPMQCTQRQYDYSDNPSRNTVNAFMGASGEEVLVLNADYADDTATANFNETLLNLQLGATLEQQEAWVRTWNSQAGNPRISIVQVDDDVGGNDGNTPPVTDDNVLRDIPEVVCETWTTQEKVTTPGTPDTQGPDTTSVIIENGGIIIGPASSLHCRPGRADVARVWIGVKQGDVRRRNLEIIPAATEAVEYDDVKYAAEVVLDVMCPPSSANQAHQASLNGGVNLVPDVE